VEVTGERLEAEEDLLGASPAEPLTAAEVRALVQALRSIVQRLATADPP